MVHEVSRLALLRGAIAGTIGAMPYLAMYALGGFQVTLDGTVLPRFETDKARALLVYLAMEAERPHRRETLTNLFWPDYPERQARRNLRQTLLRLRQGIGDAQADPPFLLTTTQTIQFNTTSDAWLDVTAFRAALREAGRVTDEVTTQQVVLLQHAAALYRGDFLAHFLLADSLDFEAWTLARREELHRQMLETLETLTRYFWQHGDDAQAEQYARHQLELDPLREASHRTLMQVLAASGQRSAALMQYNTCCRMLQQELGIEPEDATTTLYKQIQAGGEYGIATPRLASPTAPSFASPSHQHSLSGAERRQMTLLCCDLIDMSSQEGAVDPEVWHEVLPVYRRLCAQVVQQFYGYLVELRGRYLLVYFGYPSVHEDDAQRAVRAGLALLNQCSAVLSRQVSHTISHVRWAIRVSIHTGEVVVPTSGTVEECVRGIIGHPLDIVTRLLDLAEPQTVYITIATYRLVHRFFLCESRGTHTFKEAPRPMGIYQVVSETTDQGCLAATVSHATPLVGRTRELALLLECWRQAQQRGHIAFVCGEAGMGKSRLVLELETRLGSIPHLSHTCRCSPHHQHTPFYVVIDLLRELLQFRLDESPHDRLAKLKHRLSQLGFDEHHPSELARQALPLLAKLLTLSVDIPSSMRTITPQQERQQTMDVLVLLLRTIATQQPALVVVEDFHWADPSSIELARQEALEHAAMGGLLIVYTYRPDLHLPWLATANQEKRTDGPTMNQVLLSPLEEQYAAQLIAYTARDKVLPVETMQQIIWRADGVPLFLEALTRMLLDQTTTEQQDIVETGTGPGRQLATEKSTKPAYATAVQRIPETLHDVLMARLGRLGSTKEVAQLASALGREFRYPVLSTLVQIVSPEQPALTTTTLQHHLERLEAVGIVARRDTLDGVIYSFAHALIQEAAYHSILNRTRRHYHQCILQALDMLEPDLVERHPELLAQHATAAGEISRAIALWHRAGQRATRHSANQEAISHFTQALELLSNLPAPTRQRHQKLKLLVDMALPLVAAYGYNAPQVQQTYEQAITLCQPGDDTAQLLPIIRGLWTCALARADHEQALTLANRVLQHTQPITNPIWHIIGHQTVGFTHFCMGQPLLARSHLQQALDLAGERSEPITVSHLNGDFRVTILADLALNLWFLGYPGQAVQRCQQAVDLAHTHRQPFDLGFALSMYGWLSRYLRCPPQTQQLAEQVIALADEYRFPYWKTHGRLLYGWARAVQGDLAAGISEITSVLHERMQCGALRARSAHLAMLAETYLEQGNVAAGLDALAQARAFTQCHSERFFEPEIYRLTGELLLSSAEAGEQERAEAEAWFQRALSCAGEQQSRSLELRTSISLSRLWQQQGKLQPAYDLLAGVLAWFSEGHQTADQQEARAMLTTLAASPIAAPASRI